MASSFCPTARRPTIPGHIDSISTSCRFATGPCDYKPDARTNRPFAQLTIYAAALTSAGSLPPRGHGKAGLTPHVTGGRGLRQLAPQPRRQPDPFVGRQPQRRSVDPHRPRRVGLLWLAGRLRPGPPSRAPKARPRGGSHPRTSGRSVKFEPSHGLGSAGSQQRRAALQMQNATVTSNRVLAP
jgi:hypothetical protein